MNVHHLRYARAVIEQRSFSRAAEQCHVSQPSLSVAVAQLEQELGQPLFLRSTRRVELTPFGAYVAPILDEAVRGLEEVRLAAARFRENTETVIRLGLTPLIEARLLKRLIEPFERGWPGGRIILKECMLDDLDRRLAAQSLDAACTVRERKVRAGVLPLYADPLLYLPQGGSSLPRSSASRPSRSSRASGQPVRVRDLAAETFVLTVDGCGLSNAVRRLFQSHHVRLREYPGHALSYDVVEEWVALGIGAAILPASKVKTSKAFARPIVEKNGQPAQVHYELRWNARRGVPPHVEAFLDHFRRVVPTLLRGASWDGAEAIAARRRSTA